MTPKKNLDYIGYILALISIVIGLLSTWYFYNKSLRYPELHYKTDYNPESIFDVQNEVSLPFKVVRMDGTTFSGNINNATHQIWNNGSQAILPSDVIEPITVTLTDKDSSLLAVSIDKSSRAVTDCKAKLRSGSNKSFTVTFQLLEPQDGCLIKLFYSGPIYPSLRVDGTIVGNKKIIIHEETVRELLDTPDLIGRILERLPTIFLFVMFIVFFTIYLKAKKTTPFKFWLTLCSFGSIVLQLSLSAELLSASYRYRNVKGISTENWTRINNNLPVGSTPTNKVEGECTKLAPGATCGGGNGVCTRNEVKQAELFCMISHK